jgi:hypothetical protein
MGESQLFHREVRVSTPIGQPELLRDERENVSMVELVSG